MTKMIMMKNIITVIFIRTKVYMIIAVVKVGDHNNHYGDNDDYQQ